jgi:hypothetical protein
MSLSPRQNTPASAAAKALIVEASARAARRTGGHTGGRVLYSVKSTAVL